MVEKALSPVTEVALKGVTDPALRSKLLEVFGNIDLTMEAVAKSAFDEGRNSMFGTDRHHAERAWENSVSCARWGRKHV